jgi:Amt family ammonium transporter
MLANGLLAGLVAITAPCAFVNSVSAVTIGAISGVLVVFAVLFIERTMKIDDPVGAVAVHCVNGMWGILSVGLFSDGTYGDGLNGVAGGVRGLFYGDAGQLAASVIGIVACWVWVFPLFYVFFKVLDAGNGSDGLPRLRHDARPGGPRADDGVELERQGEPAAHSEQLTTTALRYGRPAR